MRIRPVLVLALLVALATPSAANAAFRQFAMPSGNIVCGGDTRFLRCDILHHSWHAPKKPRSCEFDWGNTLEVGLRGKGRFGCVSDAIDPGRELSYGESIARGRFRCRSRRSGMRCVNSRNGHGFALSRERVRRF